MKFYAFIAVLCLFAAPAFCANEQKAPVVKAPLPQHVEFYLKSGMGCVETIEDAYPTGSGGFGFVFPKTVYGLDLLVGLDTQAYADHTRQQAGAWLKSVVTYRPFKTPYVKNLYTGLGFSAGFIRKSVWTEMTDVKKTLITEDWQERSKNPNSKEFDPKWEPAPEDRFFWDTDTLGGLYVEALLGYEWHPTFFRNIVSLGGQKQEALVPLRMFIELSARHAAIPVKSSSISQGPYVQVDLGVGF